MSYVFLTACRNEELILDEFLGEFTLMLRSAGIEAQSVLYIVDDLSTDRTRDILKQYASAAAPLTLRTIDVPTNFGNQGAMFYGLGRLEIADGDTLITFDCDGEDDVREVPTILALGAEHPGKIVLVERGRRTESTLFKLLFASYKSLFRILTRQRVVPNNFMLIPGTFVPAIRRSPLSAVHLAYGILKLNPPRVTTTRDRRARYGGQSSQNLFMLVSHGMVGLMVFYEIVVAKLFLLLFVFGAFAGSIVGFALLIPASNVAAQRLLIWAAIAAGIGAIGVFALLLSAALALVFKLAIFTLSHTYGEQLEERKRRTEGASLEQGAAPIETRDTKAH